MSDGKPQRINVQVIFWIIKAKCFLIVSLCQSAMPRGGCGFGNSVRTFVFCRDLNNIIYCCGQPSAWITCTAFGHPLSTPGVPSSRAAKSPPGPISPLVVLRGNMGHVAEMSSSAGTVAATSRLVPSLSAHWVSPEMYRASLKHWSARSRLLK